mmetsp:Transcript_93877/g.186193  ORF Transcript_93877/g.186193 Transcript_93877/m.186193 type:complete len:268 (+) Transcript_93877:39-842(+)
MASLFHRRPTSHNHILHWQHHRHRDPVNSPAYQNGYQQLLTQELGDLENSNKYNDIARSGKEEELLKKAEMKASVFDTYAVCAALLASFSCSATFVNQDVLAKLDLWPTRICISIQQILIRLCVVGAVNSMLVFMLSALYCKSALSRETYNLKVYNRFNAETGGLRQRAFWSMYYTAVAYCCQASLSSFQTFSWEIASIVTIAALLLVGKLVWDAQSIIKSAGMIFLPEEALKAMFDDVLDVETGILTDASDDEGSNKGSGLSNLQQ